MVAGPNGSGKTTLAEYFQKTLALPLGHYLNPDDFDRELLQTGRLDLGRWGLGIDPGTRSRRKRFSPVTSARLRCFPRRLG
jgi:hypothetical protein